MSNRPAFTIVELLVVIAVIAILAGTVIPAITLLHDTPTDAMCLQNQSSIYKGLALYASDWGGAMPKCRSMRDSSQPGQPIADHGDPDDHSTTWNQHLCTYPREMLDGHPDYEEAGDPHWQAPRSYVAETDTFTCPSADPEGDLSRFEREAYGEWTTLWGISVQGSYGLNCRRAAWSWPSLWDIPRPAECYLFADSWIFAFDHIHEADRWYAERHGPAGDFVNIMFNDGHSESTTEDDIITVEESMYNIPGAYGRVTPWWGGFWD